MFEFVSNVWYFSGEGSGKMFSANAVHPKEKWDQEDKPAQVVEPLKPKLFFYLHCFVENTSAILTQMPLFCYNKPPIFIVDNNQCIFVVSKEAETGF